MTNPPAEILRQMEEGERVLWHARPRLLRLMPWLRNLLVTACVVWFIAFLGRHSLGCMVNTWAKILAGILLAIPVCQLAWLLWYLFTTSQTHYTLTNRRAIISRGEQLVGEYPLAADMLARVEPLGNNCAAVCFTIEAGKSFWMELPRTTGQGFIDTPHADTLLRLLAEHALATTPRRGAVDLDQKTRYARYRKESGKENLVIFICAILAGLYGLGKGIAEIGKVHHLNSTGTHTTAIVQDSCLGEKTGPRSFTWGHVIYLDVTFRDAGDTPHSITLRCRNGEDTRYFTPGAELPLVYPAGQPEAAQLALPWEQYHECIWAILCGSLFVPVGVWQMLIWRNARNSLKQLTQS